MRNWEKKHHLSWQVVVVSISSWGVYGEDTELFSSPVCRLDVDAVEGEEHADIEVDLTSSLVLNSTSWWRSSCCCCSCLTRAGDELFDDKWDNMWCWATESVSFSDSFPLTVFRPLALAANIKLWYCCMLELLLRLGVELPPSRVAALEFPLPLVEWSLWCSFKCTSCVNLESHLPHSNGRSPLWSR